MSEVRNTRIELEPRGAALSYSLDVHSAGATGPDTALVLVHGYGDNLVTWKALTSLLEARGQASLRLDLPGFGGTRLPPGFASEYVLESARVLLAWLEQCAPRARVTIVGNSLGGSVALAAACLELAGKAPASIGSLVLLAPATPWTRTPPFVKLLDLPVYGWMEALSRRAGKRPWRAWNGLLARLVIRAMTAPGFRPDPEWRAAVTESFTRPGAWADLEELAHGVGRILSGEARETLALFDHLSELALPVQIVRGTLDPVIGAAELERLAERIPGAHRVELDGVGHCPQMEAAQETAQLALDALGRQPNERDTRRESEA